VFDEDASWDWAENQIVTTDSKFSIEGHSEDF
jgi:hypothetical protein